MTLPELQAQREAILRQMAQPEEVRFADSGGVRYRTMADLEKALAATDAQIAAAQGTSSRTSFARFSKGQ